MLKSCFFFFCSSICFSVVADSYSETIETLKSKAYRYFDVYPDSSMILGKEIERLAFLHDDPLNESEGLNIQGWCHKLNKEPYKAFSCYYNALKLIPIDADSPKAYKDQAVSLLWDIAYVSRHYKMYEEASRYYDYAIELTECNENKYRKKLAVLYYNRAEALYRLDDNKAVGELISNAFSSQGLDSVLISRLHNLKGLLHVENGAYDSARLSFNDGISKTSNVKLNHIVLLNCINIAFSYKQEGNKECALASYKYVVDFAEENCLIEEVALKSCLRILELSAELGEINEALKYGQQGVVFYDQVDFSEEYFTLFLELSNLYYQLGKYDLAQEMSQRFAVESQRYLEYEDEIQRIKKEYQFKELTASFFDPSEEKESYKNTWMMILAMVLSLLLCGGVFRAYYIRRNLQKSFRDIHDAF